MTSLDIRIYSNKLSIFSKSSKITISEDRMKDLIESFANYIRALYLRMIYEAMHSRRYKEGWEPVSDPNYVEYLGTDPVSDIFSVISETLEVVKVGPNFIVRFNPYKRYPGSSLPLVRVLRAIDGGTRDFSSRPIFYKCTSRITLSLYPLWKGFLSMRGVI